MQPLLQTLLLYHNKLPETIKQLSFRSHIYLQPYPTKLFKLLFVLYCNILMCMQKHSQHNKDERTHFFRKNIPLTLFERVTKELCVRGELETEQNCNILTSSSSGYSSTSFSSCGAAQPGALRAQPLLGLVLTASNCNNWFQTLISN